MIAARPEMAARTIAVAVIAALLLRCWHISSWPLWLDESWSRWMTEQSWPGLLHATTYYDTHPPLYYALLKAWTWAAPATPAGLRSLSVVCGLAMLPFAWACAGRIETLGNSAWARALAVALVAVSPPLIVAATQARPYAMFALAFALALWAALSLIARAGHDEPPESRRAGLAVWALYLAGFEATLWLHSLGPLFAVSLAGGLFLALAANEGLRRTIFPFLAVHLLAASAWLPGLLILLEQRRDWSASSWLHFSWASVPRGLASGLVAPGPGILFLAFAAIGAWALLRGRRTRSAGILLVTAALLPAALAIMVSVLLSPVFLPRILVPSVLPIVLLAAASLPILATRLSPGLLATLALALLAPAAIANAAGQPEEKWDELSAWLEPRIRAREELWLLPNEIALPFRYGGARKSEPRKSYAVRGLPADFPAPAESGPRPSGSKAVPGMTEAAADRLVSGARARGVGGIWVISRFPGLFDPGGTLPRAFGQGRQDLHDTRFAPLIVDHYRLQDR